jgi:hypothetical protein
MTSKIVVRDRTGTCGDGVAYSRLGMLHVPRCAGTTLGTVISQAVGGRQEGLLAVGDFATEEQPRSSVLEGEQIQAASELPFLFGHIGLTEMSMLDRTWIFTVLRHPYARLFSQYRYFRERHNVRDPLGREIPYLTDANELPLFDYLGTPHLDNVVARLFLKSEPDSIKTFEKNGFLDKMHAREIALALQRSLLRFGAIYVGASPFRVLRDLQQRGVISAVTFAHRSNASSNTMLVIPSSTKVLIDLVRERTWADVLLWRLAAHAENAVRIEESPDEWDIVATAEAALFRVRS